MYTILYIERYRSVEKVVLPVLTQHYEVVVVQTRRDAIQALEETPPDLVLINVPAIRFKLDRFCDDLREQLPNCPIFMLLSKGTRLDQLPRVNIYLRHPFTSRQLFSRLDRALPKRNSEIITWLELQLDTERRFLRWHAHQVPFTPKQAELMQAFLQSPETLLSRAHLMQEVWGTDYLGDTRTLDVHIHWLRKALKTLEAPFALKTHRGKGYRLISLTSQDASEGDK
jgi:DNA-binding response OmpR family regulator